LLILTAGALGLFSLCWKPAHGVILSAWVEGNRANGYYCYLRYHYLVDGAVYTSIQPVSSTASGHAAALEQIVHYPAGKTVPLYYAALNPAHSLLEKPPLLRYTPHATFSFLLLGVAGLLVRSRR